MWKTGEPTHHPVRQYKDERITHWSENYVFKMPSGEIIAIYSDETKRKQSEEKIRASEEKFRMIADNTNDYIWILDIE